MKKLIEHYSDFPFANQKKEKLLKQQYIKYRTGRIKHELWLKNRKLTNDVFVEKYDWFIINNLKPGNTCFFCSAGYYVDKLIDNLTVVENSEIVKHFYPDAFVINDRNYLSNKFKNTFDNFVVNNNRGDHWGNGIESISEYIGNYTDCLKFGGLLFYSFRDTQIPNWNRLTENHYDYFFGFAKSLEKKYNLNLIWHDIKFAKKIKDGLGKYDMLENPDTTNGNIKLIFQYKKHDYKINEKFLNE